jgi:hypothetical protein
MSRREQIRMSAAEVASFLAGERTVTCATVGPRGWPHLMPLWYVLRDPSGGGPGPRLWAWTYAASQKVRNLERDPRATLQVEAGEAYEDLRGVMFECDVVIHRDLDTVASLGEAILLRWPISTGPRPGRRDRAATGPAPLAGRAPPPRSGPRGLQPPQELPSQARDAVAAQAAKRVALEFLERRRASWDHRKLGGVH